MSTVISQQENNVHQSGYITAITTTTTTTPAATAAAVNDAHEKLVLCAIKLICTQRKKKSKRHTHLTFVDSCSISTSSEQPCIEIVNGKNSSSILLNECISFEYFDTVKNDFQSFIFIYYESYTVSIYFSDEHINKKPIIIKHLEYMCQKRTDINEQLSSHELSYQTTTEHILHTFDIKLLPSGTILSRDHVLIGSARIYFTTTDLYVTSIDCNRIDLKTTITNQCPSKDHMILCIPYFTIKHYGNRSNIFLIELGKSNYGNGEIHMKCYSPSLASTIHLLASPVIEERPLILSSAFQNKLLTSKRMEKSKNIHPPIQLTHDITNQAILDPSLSFLKKDSIGSISTKSNEVKSRSVAGFFRKILKNSTSLRRSSTFDSNQDNLNEQSKILSTSLSSKLFELNIEENRIILPKSQTTPPETFELLTTKRNLTSLISSSSSVNRQETTIGSYIDMGPVNEKTDHTQQLEMIAEEPKATRDMGVNTTISIPSYIRSAIIVGGAVHLIAEEKSIYPIGQRSFTSPASVMQPFKAQLTGQTTLNTYPISTDMIACASTSSFHHPTSTSSSQQSLCLSYGIVTFNNPLLTMNNTELESSLLCDDSTIERRLNSDLSLMSTSHQQQPSNSYSFSNILSSSSSSHIFRTLSLSTNNTGDNTSHGNILVLDENVIDQTTNYLLGPAPTPSLVLNDDTINQTNIPTSLSRSYLSHIVEEKSSSNDPYALIEPLTLSNSAISSLSTIHNEPSLSSDKSLDYIDLLLPKNIDDEQRQDFITSDDNHIEQSSSTRLYTDIDFHQTQRRDRIVQFAEISKIDDQTPPFIL
ncbi:unnamed protein product [Adineta steineri]|uniref:Uncharacterized protein n=1 Tax=Adineta steineri TaxID=433720 RepID=A0A813T6Y8_9BILA|nr:unnamed protein product [Adineta steineri]CAF0811805.1 unnamed protein product [Adineta steineri]CAF0819637.1 unnamed protein product [Adineta steineri]